MTSGLGAVGDAGLGAVRLARLLMRSSLSLVWSLSLGDLGVWCVSVRERGHGLLAVVLAQLPAAAAAAAAAQPHASLAVPV